MMMMMMVIMRMMMTMKDHLIGAIGAPPRPEHWILTRLSERLRHHLPHLTVSVLLRASILKYVLQNKERSVQDLSQLLPVFVKVVKVTWVCQSCYMHLPSCYMYFSPNQTQMKFDKDFEAR